MTSPRIVQRAGVIRATHAPIASDRDLTDLSDEEFAAVSWPLPSGPSLEERFAPGSREYFEQVQEEARQEVRRG